MKLVRGPAPSPSTSAPTPRTRAQRRPWRSCATPSATLCTLTIHYIVYI